MADQLQPLPAITLKLPEPELESALAPELDKEYAQGTAGTTTVKLPAAMALGFNPDLTPSTCTVAEVLRVIGPLYTVELVVGVLPSVV